MACVSADLSVAGLSLCFGVENKKLLAEINQMSYHIRKKLAARVRNQMRKFLFKIFLDDSVDYAQNIESLFNYYLNVFLHS